MSKAGFNPREALRQAKSFLKSGKLAEARSTGLRILQHFPLHQDTNYLLAQISCDEGQYPHAIQYLQSAFASSANMPVDKLAYYNVLNKYLLSRQYDLLEEASLWLTKFMPRDGIAWDYLGLSLIEQGRYADAHAALLKAIALLPNNPHVLCNLGNALISLERCAEAVPILRKAISLSPNMVVAHNNLGNALRFIGNPKGAIESIETAIKLDPTVAYLYNNIGLAYRESGLCAVAIDNYYKALELQPDLIQVYPNLIDALRQNGQVQDAIDCSQNAMQKCEQLPEFWGGFGDALREANHLDAAIEAYVRALGFKSDTQSSFNRRIYTNLLFCLNYHPDLSAELIYNAYHEFDLRFGQPLRSTWKSFNHLRDPLKKLKIGYVGPVFYNQVCKYFLIPLLEHHDRNQVEIYAYAGMPFEDDTTQYYKKLTDHWIPTRELTDEQLADRIRADEIDVLIDLAGHTNNNRLPVFARKPAPVSLHWLEYGYTTGLSAIDYYLTDKPSVAGQCDHLFAEKIWCLDGPAYVYRPDVRRAELNESPASQTGIVTFGSLSRSTRINHRVVKLWATILDAMPNSRLMINSGDFKDVQVQEEMASRFMRYGIDRSRLEIGFSTPSWEVLKHVDIGLDCFPHNSGTTLLETLYMGIPFVTLTERPSVGRIGASVLTGMGRTEWIASTEEEYAQKAIVLAHDIDGLVHMRKTMRQEMEASALMDEPAFARSVEKAYRMMWQRYCEEPEV
ncbi:tetratricopeptide repeat protein [Undibacterium sp. RuTC16W]|uniref:O-linked N-acetylglucosamine transferase, SPINDLY family protein n=1 Tax=Undibacterium sp. RuTC16W TaxID=3413048 RepID=UPI003BF103EC